MHKPGTVLSLSLASAISLAALADSRSERDGVAVEVMRLEGPSGALCLFRVNNRSTRAVAAFEVGETARNRWLGSAASHFGRRSSVPVIVLPEVENALLPLPIKPHQSAPAGWSVDVLAGQRARLLVLWSGIDAGVTLPPGGQLDFELALAPAATKQSCDELPWAPRFERPPPPPRRGPQPSRDQTTISLKLSGLAVVQRSGEQQEFQGEVELANSGATQARLWLGGIGTHYLPSRLRLIATDEHGQSLNVELRDQPSSTDPLEIPLPARASLRLQVAWRTEAKLAPGRYQMAVEYVGADPAADRLGYGMTSTFWIGEARSNSEELVLP